MSHRDAYSEQQALFIRGSQYPPRTMQAKDSSPISLRGKRRVAKALTFLDTFRPHPDPVAVHPPVLPISDDAAMEWAQAEPERMTLPWSTVKSLAWMDLTFRRRTPSRMPATRAQPGRR